MLRKAKKLYAVIALALAAILLAATAAVAAVTFDPETGTGFVGKGDVQTALGLNNAQLQSGTFNFTAVTTGEASWTCSRPAPTKTDPNREITQERATTTTTQDVVSNVARVKNQITGFNLTGFSGEPQVTTDGPEVGSCPNPESGFTFDEGSLQETPGTTQLFVNGVALT